jgi:Zn-dependent protease
MAFRSIPLFRVFGITLEVHPTFFLLPIVLALANYSDFGWRGIRDAWWALFLVYSCVVLHEFGHALVARRLGVPVSLIILLPVGGMALLGRIPRYPRAELLIVAAGPLVNFIIAAVCLTLLGHWPDNIDELNPATLRWPDLLGFLAIANLALGCFNLLPAFPMDGGRLLRACLAYRYDYLRATYLAMMIGRVVAALGIIYAIFAGFYLLAILFGFILFLGDLEYNQLRREESFLFRPGPF